MKDFQYELEELLTIVLKENASDLHISVGRYPTLRIDGQLIPLAQEKYWIRNIRKILFRLYLPNDKKSYF